MHTKDQIIKSCCDEKMKVVLDMMELFTKEDVGLQLKSVYKDDEGQELLDPEEILQRALREGGLFYLLKLEKYNLHEKRYPKLCNVTYSHFPLNFVCSIQTYNFVTKQYHQLKPQC